jgi:hypothetical protein
MAVDISIMTISNFGKLALLLSAVAGSGVQAQPEVDPDPAPPYAPKRFIVEYSKVWIISLHLGTLAGGPLEPSRG